MRNGQPYARQRLGKSYSVYAAVNQDTHERLQAFVQSSGLTVSGAVHHLLRLQLGLEPKAITNAPKSIHEQHQHHHLHRALR